MEAAAATDEKLGLTPWLTFRIPSSFRKLVDKLKAITRKLKKIAEDDPRRIRHSLKVGLALTVASISYYVNPFFSGLGASTMWAVLTVVVVMEYTAGATLSKGLNRAFATLLAGAVGVGAHRLAALAGEEWKPVFLSLFVFLLAAMATFSRFVPEIKARYDYGVLIFIMTFSLVAVSGYRVEELIQLAHQRLSTVAIGVAACLVISIFVFPVWAGEDLHNLVASNLDKQAAFLEGVGKEYFEQKLANYKNLEGASFLTSYKTVLNSKVIEDSLANFARWEPGHGRFGFRHPWKQYLKICALTRQCACSIDSLNTFISNQEKTQVVSDPEFQQNIRTACSVMSSESGKTLAELAAAIREMRSPFAAAGHLINATSMESSVKTMAPSQSATLSEVLFYATTVTLLLEVVRKVRRLWDAVEELASIAEFKRPEQAKSAAVKRAVEGESSPHVVVDMRG
ncbi:hypothetical protein HPP92_015556 [Vanilla planifolia]|uniref:Aluminum-activated malate transporter n=1 Tax=Vanilla planifolia TaxID=51239 RepID=A0A835USI1_VANPL|nr:hypothetical protein HPP92_016174 [Vanilla planifolia]KAG0471010.1 hypothetical protein HPP92_015556 [Vanilla planifolia]